MTLKKQTVKSVQAVFKNENNRVHDFSEDVSLATFLAAHGGLKCGTQGSNKETGETVLGLRTNDGKDLKLCRALCEELLTGKVKLDVTEDGLMVQKYTRKDGSNGFNVYRKGLPLK
ncbi:MAG: hypothetical protein IJ748_02790 [Bacteroidales bacterium]|nr:hypothetical protein [Bacteroidales bacterium]